MGRGPLLIAPLLHRGHVHICTCPSPSMLSGRHAYFLPLCSLWGTQNRESVFPV